MKASTIALVVVTFPFLLCAVVFVGLQLIGLVSSIFYGISCAISHVFGRKKNAKPVVRHEDAPGKKAKPERGVPSGIVWTEEYDRAMAKLLAPVDEEPVVFVTGPGGVGKSLLMREMEKKWRTLHPCDRIAKLAPTGVAAAHIDGRTIHSFFLFNPEELAPQSKVAEKWKAYQRGRELSLAQIKKIEEARNIGLILVDEISMLKPDLLDAMDDAMRILKGTKRPFGGCKTVFFGDLGQLPPVYKEEWERAWYLKNYGMECPYFFEARVIKSNPRFSPETWPVHLTKVFRQDDARFVKALQHLRCWEWKDDDVALFDSRYSPDNQSIPPEKRTTLFCTNAAVDQLNADCLAALSGTKREYEMQISGTARYFKDNRFKYQKILVLAIGARVMILKNNLPDYHNGTVGIVVDLNDNFVSVRDAKTNKLFTIQRDVVEFRDPASSTTDEERRKGGKIIGSYAQFPLRLAWAVTIHKSQGQTYDEAYVDVSGNFSVGHVYTAFSRVRSLDGLHLLSPEWLPQMAVPSGLKPWLVPANSAKMAYPPCQQPPK